MSTQLSVQCALTCLSGGTDAGPQRYVTGTLSPGISAHLRNWSQESVRWLIRWHQWELFLVHFGRSKPCGGPSGGTGCMGCRLCWSILGGRSLAVGPLVAPVAWAAGCVGSYWEPKLCGGLSGGAACIGWKLRSSGGTSHSVRFYPDACYKWWSSPSNRLTKIILMISAIMIVIMIMIGLLMRMIKRFFHIIIIWWNS